MRSSSLRCSVPAVPLWPPWPKPTRWVSRPIHVRYRPTSMTREVRTVKADLVDDEVHVYAPEVVDISLPRHDRDHHIPLPASHLTPSLAERIYWINPDGTKERMQIEDTR